MKYTYGLALAAAIVFGCASSNKSTTASNENPTATPQSGSIEGTSSTAGTTASNPTAPTTNTQGTATASNPTTPNAAPSDTASSSTASAAPSATSPSGSTSSGTSSTYGTTPSDTGSSTAGNAPGTPGSTPPRTGDTGTTGGTSGSASGSTYGSTGSTSGTESNATGTSGSSATGDNLKTITGSVAKVDQNSITFDQAAGGVTLTVDSNTQVLRRGQPIAAGISAIHEGEQVRASFDPASNRADKIEVMGRMKHHHKMNAPADNSQTPPPDNTNPNPR